MALFSLELEINVLAKGSKGLCHEGVDASESLVLSSVSATAISVRFTEASSSKGGL